MQAGLAGWDFLFLNRNSFQPVTQHTTQSAISIWGQSFRQSSFFLCVWLSWRGPSICEYQTCVSIFWTASSPCTDLAPCKFHPAVPAHNRRPFHHFPLSVSSRYTLLRGKMSLFDLEQSPIEFHAQHSTPAYCVRVSSESDGDKVEVDKFILLLSDASYSDFPFFVCVVSCCIIFGDGGYRRCCKINRRA